MKESDYIYGRRTVTEALRSTPERINKLFIARGSRGHVIDEIFELARNARIITKVLPKQSIERYVPGSTHQGVVASITPVDYADPNDLMDPVHRNKPALVMALDGLTDPQNFGAILRTAEAVGVSGVFIPRHRSVAMTSVVAKHSAGASQFVPVARTPNIARLIDDLKDNTFQIAGMSGEGESTIYEVDFKIATCIVIGSEGKGVRPLVRKKCDIIARIPMLGKISSLNASVAAAVTLYEALRQREGGS